MRAPRGSTVTQVLIACAFQREVDPIRARLQSRAVFAVTGLGGRRTSNALTHYLRENSPRLIIFSGTAGQLDPGLKMGEVVAPLMWKLEDGRTFCSDASTMARLHKAGWPLLQSGLTVDRPVLRPRRRVQLWHQYQAGICDMESAAALEVAGGFEIPAISVKVVSDTADSSLLDFWRSLDRNLSLLAERLELALTQLGF